MQAIAQTLLYCFFSTNPPPEMSLVLKKAAFVLVLA